MKHSLLLGAASLAVLVLAAPAHADQSAPPSYGVAAGWPGGAGQVTVQQIASPTLNTLSLSPLTATAGSAYSGTVSGDTAGSTLTLSNSDGGACSFLGHTVTCPSLTAGTANIAVTETLAGATNSPNTTPFGISVSALAGYTPNAVLFSNALSGMTTNGVAMTTAAGTVPDTSHFTIFMEFRLVGFNSTMHSVATSAFTGFVSSEENTTDGTESFPGIMSFVLDNASGNYGTWRFNIGDASAAIGATAHNCNMQGYFNTGIQDGNWHYALLTGNLTSSGTTKDTAEYIDGVETAHNCVYATGGTMLAGISERGFVIRDFLANSNYSGAGRIEFGDVFADFATDAICMDGSTPLVRNGVSYACTAVDTVPTALLQKFWNSGPQDLGSNGSAAFGRQPEIFLGHGATASNWMTNLGSVTNLTTTGPLYNADYGPGSIAPAHKAYVSWSVTVFGATTDTSEAVNTGGNTFTAGDLIIYAIQGAATNGTDHGLGSACPTGFTLLQYQAPDTNTGSSTLVCTKTATGSEGPTITSGTFTAFARGIRYAILDVKNATGVRTSSVGVSGDTSSGSSTLTSPTLTGTSGDTLLTFVGSYNSTSNGGSPYAVMTPAAGDLVLSSDFVNVGSAPQITITQELLNASGTTAARTFNETNGVSGLAQKDWANIVSIDVQPK